MAVPYNAIIGIGELVYIFAIAVAMDVLVSKRRISESAARKVIHLWMGGLIVFWFLPTGQYAKVIFSIPILAFVAVMLTALPKRAPHATKVFRFARERSRTDVIYGPLILMAMLIFFTVFSFRSIAGVAAICAVSFGDGIAPIAGKYACAKYANGKKSIEGSLAFFVASLFSIFIFTSILLPGSFTVRVSRIAVLASAVGAVAEGITPGKFDNLTVSILVWLIFLLV